MKRTRNAMGNSGFTLIEIIAVMVILGILAAVAIPKYVDLQQQAAVKAVQGALAAVKSQATMDYTSAIMTNAANATSWAGDTSVLVGDFSGSYKAACNSTSGIVSASVTSGPSQWWSLISGSAAALSTTFRLY